MARFINPFTDVGFKRIFGQEINKDLLIDFLNGLLEGEKHIVDIRFLDKEVLPAFAQDRGVIYDVYCTNESGEQFIVEMQNRPQVNFRERALYYLSRAVARQGERGADWQFRLKAVYGVFFMNFCLDSGSHKLRTDIVLSDRETHEAFSDKLRFIFLELPSFTKEEQECETDFERWIYVLKNMDTLQRLPFKARKSVFEKLEKIVDIAALSKEDRMKYDESIKIYRDHLAVEAYAKEREERRMKEAVPQKIEFVHDESRPTILIVEDNKEMAVFIADEVNQLYNVEIAENGAEAITLLKKRSIQLIISDVMMPVMDGFALLKEVKTEIEFSHIPVILLTAKNTIQSRLEGLELGADAYLDKPFSTNLLMAQISNLISNRDNIRKFYFNSPIANMKSMAYTKADESFLEKLNEIINEHIGNPALDVNMIADLMHLSRPTLYRKIRAISDLTPNELIKISRLKKAAELLIQGNMKIYEISEATGFSSQSYFWSAFIKQFGMSPSNYAKENK